LETGKVRHELFNFNQRQGSGNSVVFSHDGKRLAASSPQGTLVWDLETGAAKQDDAGHFGDLETLKFSPQGDLIASAAEDGTARIWEAASGRQRHVLRHGPASWA